MQILGLSLLCLTLALLSDTGIGQALGNLRCSDCKDIIQNEDDGLTRAVRRRVQSTNNCHGSIIRFTGKVATCAKNNLQWVKDITECLKQGIDYSKKFNDCRDCPDCRDCKLIVPNDEDKWKIVAMNLSVQSHDKCSDSIIRFNLNNGAVLCGHNAHQWVQNVIKSLAKDPNPEFSRGASVNPSTATLNPTTIPVTMVMTPTATAQNPNMATSREAIEMTRPSKPSVANNGTHNGHQENVTNLLPSNSNKGALTTPPPTTLNPTTTPEVTVLMTTTTAKNPDMITPREIITTTTPSQGPRADNGNLGKLGENVTNFLPSTSNKGALTTPPPTTLKPTTTPKVTVLMTTTTTTTAKNPDMNSPREIITTTTPSNGSLGKLGGGKSSSEPFAEHKSEINQMKTTIISLVFIVLVMVAAGTGIFCYKKKLPCLEKPIQYTQAPSQDTLEMGTTTT